MFQRILYSFFIGDDHKGRIHEDIRRVYRIGGQMNKDKAGELLGKFWQAYPRADDLDDLIYWIDLFIGFIYDKGLEICPREFVSNEGDK